LRARHGRGSDDRPLLAADHEDLLERHGRSRLERERLDLDGLSGAHAHLLAADSDHSVHRAVSCGSIERTELTRTRSGCQADVSSSDFGRSRDNVHDPRRGTLLAEIRGPVTKAIY